MHWQLIFVSVAPLLTYVLFWRRGAPFVGVGLAIVVSALELWFNSRWIDGVDPLSLLSFVCFVVLGGGALWRKDERLFKFQPVALEMVGALLLFYFYHAKGEALLVVFAQEQLGLFDSLAPYRRGYATVYLTTLSRSLPYVLLVHAAATAYAAIRSSTWWWLGLRIVGLYVLIALLFFLERALGVAV